MLFKFLYITWCVFLLAAGLSGILGMYGENNDDDDEEKLSDKEVKEKLEVLTNEVIQLKKEVKEMKGPDDKATDDELKILSVSRQSLPDGKVLYSIRYQEPKTSSSKAFVFWRRFENYTYTLLPETVSNEIPILPRGVMETSIITTSQNDTHIIVSIGRVELLLSLYLDNESGDDTTETDIEKPILEISPKGDIVYEPGHNASVKVVHPPKKEAEEPGTYGIEDIGNFYLTYFLSKPGDENLITNIRQHNIFTSVKEDKFLDKVEVTMNIETASMHYSGIVKFLSGTSRKSGLLRRIELYKDVPLRPSTQKGPFAEGKIYATTFVVYDGKISEGSDVQGFCAYGKTCNNYCEFYGDELSTLKLFKTVKGRTTPAHIERYDDRATTNTKLGYFEVWPKEGDPSPVTYTCRASNIHGQTLDSKIVMSFGYNAEILKNETSFETIDNGTVELVCTARGLPLPRMTMTCNDLEVTPDVLYQSDDVISVTSTCKKITYYGWESCVAENDFQTDYHYFATRDDRSEYICKNFVTSA